MIYRLLRLDHNRVEDRNVLYLVAEVFFASILGAATNFTGAFVVRLGATNAEIGLLSSIPALLAAVLSIPAGSLLQRLKRRKPWLLACLLIYRIGFVFVALVPWLGIKAIPQGTLMVVFLIIMSIPMIFFNVGFTAMLADIIPENRRVSVFTSRNVISSAAVSVLVFLFGQFLIRVIFPLNYTIMLIFGFVTSLLSLYNLSKLQVPDAEITIVPQTGKTSLKQRLAILRQTIKEEPAFVRITLNTFLYSFGMWVAGPLYILLYVRELKATDAWLGTLGTIANLTVFIGYGIWRWLTPRLGESRTLKLTIVTMGLLPLMVGLTSSLTFALFAVAINGLLSPGVSLTQLTMLLKSMPEYRRNEFTAVYTALMNVGVFISPLVGVTLATGFGVAPTLVACGVVAILGGISFWIWPLIDTR